MMTFKSINILKNVYNDSGILYLLKKGPSFLFNKIYNRTEYLVLKNNKKRNFCLENKKYEYFIQLYNNTWKNERTVEIPIILEYIKNNEGMVLELGNVLSNYIPVNHDILDKYDCVDGVINQDAVSFKSDTKYDLIVSISTLEHIGWDETPKDPEKVLLAIENMQKCLSEKGKFIFTFPVDYNPYLDKIIEDDKLNLKQKYFLKKISKDKWIESNWDNVKNVKFNEPFKYGNAIVMGVITK